MFDPFSAVSAPLRESSLIVAAGRLGLMMRPFDLGYIDARLGHLVQRAHRA